MSSKEIIENEIRVVADDLCSYLYGSYVVCDHFDWANFEIRVQELRVLWNILHKEELDYNAAKTAEEEKRRTDQLIKVLSELKEMWEVVYKVEFAEEAAKQEAIRAKFDINDLLPGGIKSRSRRPPGYKPGTGKKPGVPNPVIHTSVEPTSDETDFTDS